MIPARLYALTSGEYSDYRVLAVFMSRDHAEAAAALDVEIDGSGYGAANEIRETIPYFIEPAREGVQIKGQFHVKDGAVVGSYPREETRVGEWVLERSGPCAAYLVHNGQSWFWLKVEGLDVERCRKVYSEKRAQLVAQPWVAMSNDEIAAAVGARIAEQW
jgi:hypothetical protein